MSSEYKSEYDYMKAIAKNPSNQGLYDEYKKYLKEETAKRREAKDHYNAVILPEYYRKLAFLEAQDEENYEKMQKIASECNPNWLAIVSRPEIVNCKRQDPEEDARVEKWFNWAKSSHKEESAKEWQENHPSFRMDFVCHKKWNEMKPTENSKVRFCEDCEKNVYFCDNIVEARELGEQGCCIGIDVGVKRKEDDLDGELAIFGRPSAETIEENKTKPLPDRISAKRIIKKMEFYMKGKGLPSIESINHGYEDK